MNIKQNLDLLFGGAPMMRRRTFVAAGAALSIASAASGSTVGLNFVRPYPDAGGVQNAMPNSLAPTDVAGAPGYTQANWNNLGRYGDNVSGQFAVVDSAGNNSGLTVNWDATGTWAQQFATSQNTNALAQGTPDGNLMCGYVDSGGNGNVTLAPTISGNSGNNKPLVFVSGLQAWLASQSASYYDVVIYVDGDAVAGRTGEYWLQSATGTPTVSLTYGPDLTTHAFVSDRANFVTSQTYVQVPLAYLSSWVPTVPAAASGFYTNAAGGGNAGWGHVLGNNPGNYIVFPSMSADSFVLRTEEFRGGGGTLRSPVNAIQVVPNNTATAHFLGPVSDCQVYAGGTATFRGLAGGVPASYQWYQGTTALTDGGRTSGSATTTLKITGVTGGDVGSYSLVANNSLGSVTSSPAALTLVSYTANSFPEQIVTNGPYAYWRLNDPGDPTTNYAAVYDYVGGLNGIYGRASLGGFNGIAGPQGTSFPGFENGNSALHTANGTVQSWVMAPPLAVNTNTVTMCAWVYPTGPQVANSGILFSRTTNGDVCGFGIGGTANNPVNAIGYTWNNSATTANFASGLAIPSNMWSFVGVAISPTNAILWVYNASGLFSTNTYPGYTNNIQHTNGQFNGFTSIGTDPNNTAATNRIFSGYIDEVAVFKTTLPLTEIYSLYKKALHQGSFPPIIATEPVPQALLAGRTAHYSVSASGDPFLALTYQWRKNGGNLSNGGNISGANTPNLTASNVPLSDNGATYDVVVANAAGSTNSFSAALTVVASNSSPAAYEAALRAVNPLNYWRFNEGPSSSYAYDYWGGNIATNDNAMSGQTGPRPLDFPGFETTNAANSYDGMTSATETGLVGVNNNQTQFSIIGWFNMAANQLPRIGLFGQNDVTEFGFHALGGDGLSQLGIWTPNGGAAYLAQSLITVGQWYFAAGVGDGTNLNLYLFTTNGSGGFRVWLSTTAAATTNYGSSQFPFNIGGDGVLDANPTNWFNGLIDEVALFHRALSPGELSTLFAAAIGVSALPPQITTQPVSSTIYAGRTAQFGAVAIGSIPLTYQWRSNGVPIVNGGNVSGTATPTLTIANVTGANAAGYDLVVTNSAGSVTSSVATLSVITPTPGGYEAGVIANNPIAYYRLNETNGTTAFDYWGGHPGTYGSASLFNVPGPQPPAYIGFEANNTANQSASGNAASGVTNNFGTLNTNMASFTMWLYPTAAQDNFTGLEQNRGGSNPGGFGYTSGYLGYTWNNNSAATYGATWSQNLVPPLNQWSFVALVVTPTNANVYMTDPANPGNLLSATTSPGGPANVVESHGGTWQIGVDVTGGTRTFIGTIDEVAIFDHILTPSQLSQLNVAGAYGLANLTITYNGSNIIVSWAHGSLQEAPTPVGPWTANPATSPYTVPAGSAAKCYRVILH
jgi:hypothetical protein